MKKNLLIIEDDESIREILLYAMKQEGFYVFEASCGYEGIDLLQQNKIDLIILDIMLPDCSGFSICKRVCNEFMLPIIMLTAKNDIVDKLFGLELGADDYITKPFDIREVVARTKVCLRRFEQASKKCSCDIIDLPEDIRIHKNSHEVFKGIKSISLKPKEYELLLLLAENRGHVFSRDQLLDKLWGYEFEGDNRTVDVHIQRIRKKLGFEKDGAVIKTMFGIGYKCC